MTAALVEQAVPTSYCLRFIDPYGNTVFNQVQVPVLLGELDALAQTVGGTQIDVVRSLRAFLEQARAQMHLYVKFIGD